MQRSDVQLLTIINDIPDFSKVEAGRLELEAVAVDVRQLAGEVLALFAGTAARQGIALRSMIDPAIAPALLGDPTRLRQILINLLGNALKFTEQGEVLLRVAVEPQDAAPSHTHGEMPGQTLLFEVRDTGIDIAEAAQTRLFKAFSQADGSTTRQFGGSGLGLAIARELVTLMGGVIGVTSAPGVGSTFAFSV